MRAIERANPDPLYRVFWAADWGNREMLTDEILKDLIEELSEISLGNRVASSDILGDAYEYLIGKFADITKRKKAGEFYTPRSVGSRGGRLLAGPCGRGCYAGAPPEGYTPPAGVVRCSDGRTVASEPTRTESATTRTAAAAQTGVGARMRAGLRASNRRARHLPMRYETGLPSSVIRFRTLHASTASRRCPDELRARRQSPTIDVYRKNAFSTRAC